MENVIDSLITIKLPINIKKNIMIPHILPVKSPFLPSHFPDAKPHANAPKDVRKVTIMCIYEGDILPDLTIINEHKAISATHIIVPTITPINEDLKIFF